MKDVHFIKHLSEIILTSKVRKNAFFAKPLQDNFANTTLVCQATLLFTAGSCKTFQEHGWWLQRNLNIL
jgi:hypothetical protein